MPDFGNILEKKFLKLNHRDFPKTIYLNSSIVDLTSCKQRCLYHYKYKNSTSTDNSKKVFIELEINIYYYLHISYFFIKQRMLIMW